MKRLVQYFLDMRVYIATVKEFFYLTTHIKILGTLMRQQWAVQMQVNTCYFQLSGRLGDFSQHSGDNER